MTHRELSGERVDQMFEVQADELSTALSEAALLVRDLEHDREPYGPIFSIVQSWDTENEKYDLLLFVRR